MNCGHCQNLPEVGLRQQKRATGITRSSLKQHVAEIKNGHGLLHRDRELTSCLSLPV